MNNQQPHRLVTIIAVLGILAGIWSVVSSIPIVALYQANKYGTPTENQVSIVAVTPNSPAAKVGLLPRDVFISINDQQIQSSSQVQNADNSNKEHLVHLVIARDGTAQTMNVIPSMSSLPGQGSLGVALVNYGFKKQPFITIAPEVIAQTYAGKEIVPSFFGPTQIIHDKHYNRLQTLVLGLLGIIAAMGLLKMKNGDYTVTYFCQSSI